MADRLSVPLDRSVGRRATSAWRIRRWREYGAAYLYLLPAFVILGIFSYAAAIFVFYISLFHWNFLIHGDQPFAGLDNYQLLLHDPNFWQALRVNVTYVAISVPINLFVALFLALIVMAGLRARAFWRLAIFTPFITPLVATTTIWLWIFDYYHGILNALLRLVGVHPINWLGDPHWALGSIIFYTTWKSMGFNVVIFMAGLSNLSPALAEAARVDGASRWQVFRYITWPLLRPVTLVVLLLSTIEAFKMFQPVFLLEGGSGGGPLNSARTLGLYLFSQGFSNSAHDGIGAAISVIIFLLVFVVAAVQLGISGRRTVE